MLEAAERDELLALLAWWREAGVDVALDETAIDWTAGPQRWPGAAFEWPDLAKADAHATANTPATPQPARPTPSSQRSTGTASSAPLTDRAQSTPAVPRSPAVNPSRNVPVNAVAGGASPRAFPTLAPDAATMAAREMARTAPTLDALEAALRAFEGCGLKATAKNLCFYRGTAQARLMLIGEAPGNEEDREGKPFIGRSGQLLDKMLAAIGLAEADVHITNTVYWRPPGNRTPTPQETLVCRPFLERQIELVAPDVIATLGGPAAKAVLDVVDGIMKVRGKWHQVSIGGRVVRVMPTLHPAFLLRSPAQKNLAWRDLRAIAGGSGQEVVSQWLRKRIACRR